MQRVICLRPLKIHMASEGRRKHQWVTQYFHDDVIKWKHFPRYWPFVRGIHRSPVNFCHKGQWHGALMFSLICTLNKRLSKQSWGWWFDTPLRSLWRHYNVMAYVINSLLPRSAGCDVKHAILNLASLIRLVSSDHLLIMSSDECQGTLLMMSQHWFR